MKIMMVAVAFSSEMSGVQRHAFNAVRCLLLRPEISAVYMVVAPWQRKLLHSAGLDEDARLKIHLAEMDRGSAARNLWYYRSLPKLAAERQVDLVHFSYPAPINAGAFTCPTVVTLHDLYPFEIPSNFGWRKVFFNRLVLQQCLRRADAVACVSRTTQQRLHRHAPRFIEKSALIYNCVEPATEEGGRAPLADLEDHPFLLCVAQHRRNKNIPLLIRTFARLLVNRQIDHTSRLLIVGVDGPETKVIRRQIFRSGLSHCVHLLDGLSEAELHWCYTHAELLVAPSITEGFGLPVAEALLAGCRVVCSEIPAFREVGSEHCHFVALQEQAEESLASAITSALLEPHREPMLLPQFSAPAIARNYLELYRKLLTASSSSHEITNPISSHSALNTAPERRG